jgi:uroporphyrinogen decarboxylase
MIAGRNWDRVGIDEGFWPETLDKWCQQGYPTVPADENPHSPMIPANPADVFEFDLRKCGGFFDTEPMFGLDEILEETGEWILRRNGAGAALKWWKHKSGTPEHVDFQMKDRSIWETNYRPHLHALDTRRFNGKWWEPKTLASDRKDLELARQHQQWAWYGHVFVWEVMRSSFGDLGMYETLVSDPGWVEDFNRTYCDFFKAHFEYLFNKNGKPDGIWVLDDIAYKAGLFASPSTMRTLFMPYYAEIVQFFNRYGLPVIFHSDGNLEEAIPLILDAGFVGINPMEAKAGNDLLSLAEKYGDRLVFIGGMDVRIMETNDRVLIKKEVTRLIDGMKELGARYIFGSDHTITPKVEYDTYRYILDIYRMHKDY